MSGLEFLQSLEQLRSPLLTAFFTGLTELGSEEVYIVLLVTVYLCVGHRFGFHLFAMFLVSAFLNSALKHSFDTVRPYLMYPEQLHPLHTKSAAGPAFPSGHAQDSTVVWGLIAVRQGTRWWGMDTGSRRCGRRRRRPKATTPTRARWFWPCATGGSTCC